MRLLVYIIYMLFANIDIKSHNYKLSKTFSQEFSYIFLFLLPIIG